jgi:hypothetical protein
VQPGFQEPPRLQSQILGSTRQIRFAGKFLEFGGSALLAVDVYSQLDLLLNPARRGERNLEAAQARCAANPDLCGRDR